MIKISVIVPVYNAEKYLEKCMDSICSQTLKEIEIICVDDGSTDGSYQILRRYAGEDERIRLLSQTNQYAGVARNHGMKYAKGKYLSFLDADDYFEPKMLEKMYQRAEKNNSDVVVCRYVQFCDRTGEIRTPEWSFIDSLFAEKDNFSGESLKYAGIFQIARGWAWDKIFRTDYVRECRYEYPDFRSSEDGFFVYMLMARAGRISYMDDVFVSHRINQCSSLSNTKEKDWMNGFKMLLLIRDEMMRVGIYSIYQQSYLNEVNNFLSWYLESLHSLEEYRKCHAYIRESLEPLLRGLSHGSDYYFQKEPYDWFVQVNGLSFEEYLFWVREKELGLLHEQDDVIGMQKKEIEERSWVFPYPFIEKDRRVVLYGAGNIGKAYYAQLMESRFCKEVIWVDSHYEKYAAEGLEVKAPEDILGKCFDYVFIAVKNREAQEEIGEWLSGKGVPPEQIRRYGQT